MLIRYYEYNRRYITALLESAVLGSIYKTDLEIRKVLLFGSL